MAQCNNIPSIDDCHNSNTRFIARSLVPYDQGLNYNAQEVGRAQTISLLTEPGATRMFTAHQLFALLPAWQQKVQWQ